MLVVLSNLLATPLQFLDDMQWNIQDVESMGVCAVYTPRGLTADAWQKALTEYAKRRSWA